MMNPFAKELLSFYEENKRILPWRSTEDPYKIWVSEIMLQQTRVEAVKPYYARFLEALPTVADLASVKEEELFKLWEGLGYYSRVRNMQKAAKICVEQYGGKLPSTYEGLLSLPGIGKYTAGAIASFAYHLPYPAVDGNVLRVLSRYLEIETVVTEKEALLQIEDFVMKNMPKEDPASYNQALIELGATLCGPDKAARCGGCPLVASCKAFLHGKTEVLPVRKAKIKKRTEEKTVLLIKYQDEIVLQKRPPKGLLAGLFEFPSLPMKRTEEEIRSYFEKNLSMNVESIRPLPEGKHVFTHIIWEMKGYEITVGERKNFTFFHKDDAEKLPFPSAFSLYKPYM